MVRNTANISKACNPCQKSKLRCDGQEPCQRCFDKGRASECVYRLRSRIRRPFRRADGSSNELEVAESGTNLQETSPRPSNSGSAGCEPEPDPTRTNLYHSVTAAHSTEPDISRASRLFYGPSSAFAFLQHLHRVLSSSSVPGPSNDRGAQEHMQEGGPGLDLFKQRALFFGTPLRVDTSSSSRPIHSRLSEALPLEEAREILEVFKSTTNLLLPFWSDLELDGFIASLYSHNAEETMSLQAKALSFAILADGALHMKRTNLAESLFARAKQEVALCDDVVSLTMIQFSLLLASYQNNMGRPNSSYLQVGIACRKAWSMGLGYESTSLITAEDLQKRRCTTWYLYFYETMQAFILGRESTIKKANIRTPFPDDQPLLVGLCKLAEIAEECAHVVYGQQRTSLWQLHVTAEKIHRKLKACAEELSIGPASPGHPQSNAKRFQSLHIHNIFYHIILLTFRPFLIAEFALNSGDIHNRPEMMWLRQACRNATDAAQDSLVFMHTSIHVTDICNTVRFNGFFIESSCAALLYNTLTHPSKLAYTREYVNMGLECLDRMVTDEPVIHTRLSIREILRIVEDFIATQQQVVPYVASSPQGPVSPASRAPTSSHNARNAFQVFPPSDPTQQMIYFSGIPSAFGEHNVGPVTNDITLDPFLGYDVLATDLYNFLPSDTAPPPEPLLRLGDDNSRGL
ncbi:hypothetical protein F5X96DRAFT_624785 [Biscogniauxia mediterranea]|nr:hypothetical protein F5X96DRAFT_624785 [Biscogniauxia mediterranea]